MALGHAEQHVVVVVGSHSLSSLGIWLTIGLLESSYSSSRKCSCFNLKRLSQALLRGMLAGRDSTVLNLSSKIMWYWWEIFPVCIFSTTGLGKSERERSQETFQDGIKDAIWESSFHLEVQVQAHILDIQKHVHDGSYHGYSKIVTRSHLDRVQNSSVASN